MINLVRTIAPTLDIVTLDEARAHLRVDSGEDDAQIAQYVRDAVAYLDGWHGVLGWCLGAQTWRLSLDDGFPQDEIALPLGPLLSVTSIEYREKVGDAYTTLLASEYEVQTDANRVVPVTSWPSAGGLSGVRVTFRAGHETTAGLESIRDAIKLYIAHRYDNRSAVGRNMTKTPMAFDPLIEARRHRA